MRNILKTIVAIAAVWVNYAAYLAITYIAMHVDQSRFYTIDIPLLLTFTGFIVLVWWVVLAIFSKIDSTTTNTDRDKNFPRANGSGPCTRGNTCGVITSPRCSDSK